MAAILMEIFSVAVAGLEKKRWMQYFPLKKENLLKGAVNFTWILYLIVVRFWHFKSTIIYCVLRRIQPAAKVKLRENKRKTI